MFILYISMTHAKELTMMCSTTVPSPNNGGSSVVDITMYPLMLQLGELPSQLPSGHYMQACRYWQMDTPLPEDQQNQDKITMSTM